MKIKFIILLILFFVANGYAKHPVTKHHAANIPVAKSLNGIYKFKGMLNNHIPVFMWFVLKDSVLKGEITYLKTAKRVPITIAGNIDKDRLEIFEFGKAGLITGVYRGIFTANVLTGMWHAPGTKKNLNYNLVPKDTLLTITDIELKPTFIDGEYNYQFGKAGDGGVINLKHINGRDYFMELNAVTAESNVAEIERVKVKLKNNIIYYETPGADTNCKYRIRIFKGLVVIDRLSDFGGCFGMGAGPEGVFIKTSDKAGFDF